MKIDHSKFYSIYILTIINTLSFSLLIPVFPFLIKIYQQPAIALGVIASGFSLFQMFGANVLGTLSDRFGRKPILIVTQAGTFVSWIILGSAYFFPNEQLLGIFSLPMVIIFIARAVDGITGGNVSVAQAYVADVSTKEERSIVFGYLGALTGLVMIIGSALGAFSMSTQYSYVGTAILGGCISFLALCYMVFQLKESLAPEHKQHHIQFHFGQLNIFAGIKKWSQIEVYKPIFLFKFFIMTAFSMHAMIFALYLVDVFGFNTLNIGYYLFVTGSFMIINQIFFSKMIIKKVGDFRALLIAVILLSIGFLSMSLSKNIFVFTTVYFFVNLGVSLSFSTLGGLMSKNAGAQFQGEIMGLASSIDAFIFIYAPLIGTFLYQLNHRFLYAELSFLMFISLLIMFFFFRKYFMTHKE